MIFARQNTKNKCWRWVIFYSLGHFLSNKNDKPKFWEKHKISNFLGKFHTFISSYICNNDLPFADTFKCTTHKSFFNISLSIDFHLRTLSLSSHVITFRTPTPILSILYMKSSFGHIRSTFLCSLIHFVSFCDLSIWVLTKGRQ